MHVSLSFPTAVLVIAATKEESTPPERPKTYCFWWYKRARRQTLRDNT